MTVFGYEDVDRTSYGLCGCEPEKSLGSLIPTNDRPGQIFADDGIERAIHNGCEASFAVIFAAPLIDLLLKHVHSCVTSKNNGAVDWVKGRLISNFDRCKTSGLRICSSVVVIFSKGLLANMASLDQREREALIVWTRSYRAAVGLKDQALSNVRSAEGARSEPVTESRRFCEAVAMWQVSYKGEPDMSFAHRGLSRL
ncbi:hypothetical protein AGR4C_pb30094 [Agrobacterium tumefaciens str. Kerr 14]|uniref:Uncharacterized protein n=1 Tax=Agrobacterium tumefaciens str. Kerr 14 TaxID=1183424 RepID=A0A1S7SFK1_AGRTU|nr:hypothetical protein AGR4C_pb30094 [Agrobacterium tumefaciens str. Kerr 14]